MEQAPSSHYAIVEKRISTIEILYRVFYLMIAIVLFIIGQSGGLPLANPILLIFSSLFLVYRVKKNRYYLLFSLVLFLFNFSIAVNEYIDLSRQIQFTGLANDESVMNISLNVMNIFMVALNLFLRIPEKKYKLPFVENNLVFYALCAIFCILCLMKILIKQDIINKLFEYCNIIFLFLCFTSDNKKKKRVIIVFLLAVYLVSLVLSVFIKKEATGRIDFIQSFFVVFLYFYIDKLKFIHLAITGFFVVIILGIMSSMRGGVVSEMTFSSFIKDIYESVFLNDTAHFAYASSTTIVAYKKYFAPDNMPFINFYQFILAQFIGTNTSLTANSVLSLISRNYYVHYYGTCFPFYFYFWAGYIGAFIGGAMVSLFINKVSKSTKPLASLMFIMVLSTQFRWYLYSPNALFRGCLILVTVAYFIVKFFNNTAEVHYE